ncbi:hypothetical protein H072_2111 [Dactylellina haptotyla CBS 200.50]|uniref:SAP domain-containing protein n=1 Tax=Dactylellina haptotyla (strain CBS 200.50) TaxID=1284197 RepID=S8BWP0_DACHA|nr:hypothetical protein H072_2111 [Dactylellina haptotyla CBS 200.50]
MTDYSKLKVTELKELLSGRELPTTGKKDELIARLTADDAAEAANGAPEPVEEAPPAPPAPPAPQTQPVEQKEAVVAAPQTTEPEAAASAPVEGEKKKFAFKRIDDDFDIPAKKQPETTNPEESKPTEPAEPVESFAAGLSSTDAESELEKRKKRAARFGMPVDDSVKLMERAKRFGGAADEDKTIKALDSALGENRGKKRAPETRIQNEPTKKSKDSSKPTASTKAIISDPNEKAKAEARAKRFGG